MEVFVIYYNREDGEIVGGTVVVEDEVITEVYDEDITDGKNRTIYLGLILSEVDLTGFIEETDGKKYIKLDDLKVDKRVNTTNLVLIDKL